MRKRATLKTVAREIVRANPPFMTTIYTYVAPAAVGFAATRAAGYGAYKLVANRKPGWSKAAFTTGQIAALIALYYATRHKKLEKYRVAALAGSSVAIAQSILVMLVPKLAGVMGWAMPQLAAPMPTAKDFDEFGSLDGTTSSAPAPKAPPRRIVVNVPTIKSAPVQQDVAGANAGGEEVLDDLGTEPEGDDDVTWGVN